MSLSKRRSSKRNDEVSNITVIVSSKKNQEENQEFLNHLSETCGLEEPQIVLAVNNGAVGLSQLYGQMLSDTLNVLNDVIVFVHDDVEFLRPGWGLEILRLFNAHKNYGIIGVAGAAYFDEKAAWWEYEQKYGQILHEHEGKMWLTAFSPLLKEDLADVCVIDGVFMAIDRRRIKKNFDIALDGFDFYDIDFCLANYLAGVRIGVTTNIRMKHKSIGILKDKWYENRNFVLQKYNDDLPVEVKRKMKK